MTAVTLFTSPTCGPCKRLKPFLINLSKEKGFFLDIVEFSTATRPLFDAKEVKSVPCLIVTDGDKEIGRLIGEQSQNTITTKLKEWGVFEDKVVERSATKL